MLSAPPALAREQIVYLRQLQRDNVQEVVGYFTQAEDTPLLGIEQIGRGDETVVAFREYYPLIWHTHPTPRVGDCEPPSAADLMQALSWGYPDYNPDRRSHEWGLVVASDGLWWYRASEELKAAFFALQDHDEEAQNTFAKRLSRYASAVLALFKNGLITCDKLVDVIHRVNFSWIARLLHMRPDVLQYLNDEFPLDSMHKLTEVARISCPEGFSVDEQAPGFVLLRLDDPPTGNHQD